MVNNFVSYGLLVSLFINQPVITCNPVSQPKGQSKSNSEVSIFIGSVSCLCKSVMSSLSAIQPVSQGLLTGQLSKWPVYQ